VHDDVGTVGHCNSLMNLGENQGNGTGHRLFLLVADARRAKHEMPVASATGFSGESIQARRAAHERAENVSPAGLEDAAHMVRRLTPLV